MTITSNLYDNLKREIECRLTRMGFDVRDVTIRIPLQAFWPALEASLFGAPLFDPGCPIIALDDLGGTNRQKFTEDSLEEGCPERDEGLERAQERERQFCNWVLGGRWL